jgi:beta propeller repeat protein
MMKKLIICITTLLIFTVTIPVLTSCDTESEEKDSNTEEITGEITLIGENIQYSSQCIWGDLFVGVESMYEQGLIEQNIFSYNLYTGEKELLLTLDPSSSRIDPPSIYQNLVVWSEPDTSETDHDIEDWERVNYDIFLLDISTNQTRQITDDEYVQRGAVISGGWIVWLDDRHGTGELYPYPPPFDIYAYNLTTGQEKRLTSTTSAEGYDRLAIDDNLVVWADSRHADPEIVTHGQNKPDYNNEIYLYDLTTGQERRVTSYPGNDNHPNIYGSRIVWVRHTDNREADVFMYDVGTGQETQVSHSSYAAYTPSIYEDLVVWTDARSSKGNIANDVIATVTDKNTGKQETRRPGADIYLFDLNSEQEKRLALVPGSGFSLWVRPSMYDGFIVYMLDRQVGPVTYALTLAE